MSFHPYLYFDGSCREAFERYQEIFGGELQIMDYRQAPTGMAPEDKLDRIMHAALQTERGELLMASDVMEEFTPAAGMWVHYSTGDLEHGRSVFAGLAEGGDVRQAGQEVFWSPFYGSVIDRFGIPWQVSVEGAHPEG